MESWSIPRKRQSEGKEAEHMGAVELVGEASGHIFIFCLYDNQKHSIISAIKAYCQRG